MTAPLSIVMIGATGAVGSHAVRTLSMIPDVARLTLLGRRKVEGLSDSRITQHVVDVMDASAYAPLLDGHIVAICTLGVGEPSKASREEFVRIDKTTVLAFATACKAAGVLHFSLLCAVGADSKSRNFYLRIKGELEDGLRRLGFERLSLFEPSVILTPQNRYGFSQAVILAVMPWLNPLLLGPLRKFRAIKVEVLGTAIARNVIARKTGEEVLHFDAISGLVENS